MTEKENNNEKIIDRKKFLLAAGMIGAGLPIAELQAQGRGRGRDRENRHDHSAHKPSKNVSVLADAASECVAYAEMCVAHCVELVKNGDTSIAECIATANEVIAACKALSSLANYNSMHIKDFAKACKGLCGHCEYECKKHASRHEACRECAESCARCVEAIKRIL
ncbi:MAG: four-helix bundle copper-binding protein [Spirochaetia bacterium]|nr:four-helix bundle copper-binding protein [Spirochaetia bacterium]